MKMVILSFILSIVSIPRAEAFYKSVYMEGLTTNTYGKGQMCSFEAKRDSAGKVTKLRLTVWKDPYKTKSDEVILDQTPDPEGNLPLFYDVMNRNIATLSVKLGHLYCNSQAHLGWTNSIGKHSCAYATPERCACEYIEYVSKCSE